MSTNVGGGIIASVLGALGSLLIDRSWKRHKERPARQHQEPK